MNDQVCEYHRDLNDFIIKYKHLLNILRKISKKIYIDNYHCVYNKIRVVHQIMAFSNNKLMKIIHKYGEDKHSLYKLANMSYHKAVNIVSLLSNTHYYPPKDNHDIQLRKKCLFICKLIKKNFRKYKNIDNFIVSNEKINPKIVELSVILDNNEKIMDKTDNIYIDIHSQKVCLLFCSIVFVYCAIVIYLSTI